MSENPRHGYHAEVDIQSAVVRKFYQLPPEIVEAAGNLMERYQQALFNIGISVGRIQESSATEHTLCITMPNLGSPISDILLTSQDLEEIQRLLYGYLDMIRIISSEEEITLDPPLANFVVDRNGQIHYIDLFPPRMQIPPDLNSTLKPWSLGNSNLLTEFVFTENGNSPEQSVISFLEERYYGRRFPEVVAAQILRQMAQNSLIRSNSDFFINWLRDRLTEVFSDFDLLVDLPYPLTPSDCDRLRVHAGINTLTGVLSPEKMHTIFDLTHIKPGGILPSQENMNMAYNILMGYDARIQGNNS